MVAHAQGPTETPALSPTSEPTAEPPPTEEPTPTETPTATEAPTVRPGSPGPPTEEPTSTETPALSPTKGPTETPTEVATLEPTATETATVRPGSPEPPTATPTLSPTKGPTLTITPPFSLTVTPTVTPTATATLTPTGEPGQLALDVTASPATATPGQAVTVSLRLTNTGQSALNDVTLTALVPAGLQYQAPLGELAPQYDPRTHLLTWHLALLRPERAIQLGYRARVELGASPGLLTLETQSQVAGLADPIQASTAITVEAAIEPTPTPTEEAFEIPIAGPPAKIRLAVHPTGKEAGQRRFWLAVHVVDADDLPVADGTEVQLSSQNAQLDRDMLRTKNGVALTRLRLRSDEVATVTAVAGAAQSTLQVGGQATDEEAMLGELLPRVRRIRGGYGDKTLARIAARNAVEVEGSEIVAENRARRVAFEQASHRLTFTQKTQERGEQNQSLAFQLMDVRIGRQSLLPDRGELLTSGNWIAYWPADHPWQMIYEVGDASVEQFFVFEEGTPVDGDLVIEGRFTTALRPVLLSDEEGVLFKAPGARRDDEAEERDLAYGPAVVEDARGQTTFARMELQGRRLRLTIPAEWLARAEFPVVVDPLIGPAELVSGLQGDARRPAIAYDGTNFLTVWDWNGDIYGQRVNGDGELVGELITISQAEGSQRYAGVTYNPISGEYLVAWADARYGWPYYAVYTQRVSPSGALIGDEIQVTPPFSYLGYFGGAKVTVSEAGDYLIVWSHHNSGSGYDIHGQMLDQDGNLVGDMIAINGTAPEYQRYSDVAYDDQTDTFLVIWADTYGGNVYGQRLDANGTLLGNNQTLVDTSGQDVYRSPSIASNDNGQFLVTWSQKLSSSDYDVFAVRVAAATGDVEGSIINVDTGGGSDKDPAVAAISSGEYLVVWAENGYKINARRVGSDGSLPGTPLADIGRGYVPAVAHGGSQSLAVWEDYQTAGQRLIVGQRISNNDTAIGDLVYVSPYYTVREYVDLAYQPQAGEVLLIWDQAYASPNEDIFVQRVNDQGQPLGDPLNLTDVPTATQEYPRIAAGADGYLAVWQDWRNEATTGLDIYGHLLDHIGNLSGTLIIISDAANNQWVPDVAYNPQQDDYLVAWEDCRNPSDRDVFYQIVGSDGSFKMATPGHISVTGHQGYPRIVYNLNQNIYLVVFHDSRPGNQSADLFGQIINADGSLSGDSFRVMGAAKGQYQSSVAYSQAGGVFLVVWEDPRDNYQYDVYGQIVGGTGGLVGAEFLISSLSGSEQRSPAVTARSGDAIAEFVVVWQDRRNDYDRDIYLQRVDADGNLLDEPDTPADETDPTVNLPVAVDSDNYYERPAVAYNPDDDVYLLAWSNRDDGGVYAQRYTPSTPDAPTASFESDPTSGAVPLTVVFTDTSTGQIGDREWDFGDGSDPLSTTDTWVEHTYTSVGTFTVTLTVSNPGGSDSTSAVMTVGEQTTPYLGEDFEDFTTDEDPLYWLDQKASTSDSDEFEVMYLAGNKVYGSDYEGSSRYSTYAIPGWQAWQNYEYVGRLRITDAADGEGGITFYSRYPAYEQKRYELNSWEATADSFGFRATGTSLSGDLDTGVLALPDTWYRFRVQVVTHPDRTTLRGKVWPQGQAEPAEWQAVAEDASPTRLTAGAAGVCAWGDGTKYFDDLVVAPLDIQSDFRAAERTGATPYEVTFVAEPVGQVVTYTWDFGDGSDLFVTAVPTATHTYNEVGTFDVTLTVEGPAGSDTFTRTDYIFTYQPGTRVTDDLQVLYTLDEGTGTTVQDVSGVGDPLDLTLADEGAVTWVPGGLSVEAGTIISSGVAAAKVISASQASDELTIEAWLKPADTTQSGPARIVSLSADPSNRNFTLGQQTDTYQVRLRTTTTGNNGSNPSVSTPAGSLTTDLTHVVYTRDAAGQARVYLNNSVAVVTDTIDGDLSNWDETYPFILANERTEDRPWLGELHLVAVYSRALDATEVERNYNAGANPDVSIQSYFNAVTATTGPTPLEVTFVAEPIGQVITYTWDFGDGSDPLVTDVPTATHIYTSGGSFDVSLTVEGPAGSDILTRPAYIRATTPGQGLQGYWRLDEENGTRYDSSPNGNHLTDYNTVASTTGQVGLAADFELDNGEYLYIDDVLQSGLNITGSLTLIGWARPETMDNYMIMAGKYEWNVTNRAYRFEIRPGGQLALIVSPDGQTSLDYQLIVDASLATDTWYHVAGVFDAQAQIMSIYLDGELIASRSVDYDHIYPSTAPFMLGANLSNGTIVQHFDGALDEWRVYDRALSQAEIQTLMTASPPSADFTAAPRSGTVPLTVTFTDQSTGAVDSRLWDFGDGVTLTVSTITTTHTYTASGVYTVSLTASGPGGSDALTHTNYITITSTPPAGVVFWDDFDPVKETWTHYAAQGVDDWALSTDYSRSPTHAYFSSDASSVKDDYLLTSAFVVSSDAELSFWHTYELEAGGDGAVIEISTDDGATFADLGPHITAGGYTGEIATGWGSPISGQLAWTGGELGAMAEVVVDLSSYAAQSAILRFRLACDSGEGATGWYIDDVRVSGSTPPPTLIADFSAAPLTGTVPLTVTFTSLSTPWEGIAGHQWDFGDEVTSTITNPTHIYTAAGVYTVSLTVTATDSEQDVETKASYITATAGISLTADFTAAPLSGTVPLTVTFTNLSTPTQAITSALWDYGDEIISSTLALTHTHTYTAAGVYTVSLTVEGPGGSDTLTRTNYITTYEPVGADFVATPLSGTVPLTVTFTNLSSGQIEDYLWAYGDGMTGTTSALTHTHTYIQDGVYTVTLAVNGPGASDILIRPNYITVTQPTTPSALIWWDDDFFFRRRMILSVVEPITYTPGVTTVLAVMLDTAILVGEGKMHTDGRDMRVLYWDEATGWHELPRAILDPNTVTTTLRFPLQATITDTNDSYYLYYGNAVAGLPPWLNEAADQMPGASYDVEQAPVVATTLLPGVGGVLTSAEGNFTAHFPPTAITQTLVVTHTPYRAMVGQGRFSLEHFDLSASTVDGAPISRFAAPVTLTLAYSGLEVAPELEEALRFYYLDESTAVWQPIATTVNVTDDLATATVDHFTDFAVAGLTATNDSPTELGNATMLTATITAGSNVTYTWAFGNGSTLLTTGGTTSSEAVVHHTYPAVGVYTAVVTAANSVSLVTATTTVTVTATSQTCWARLNDDPTTYSTVQAAVDASTDPSDVVKVAGHCAGVNAYGGLAQTVYISKTLTVRGGYTITNWTTPDPVAHPTTLDAQGQGRVLYITGDPSAGSGQAISPTVEGLRITGGNATGLCGYCASEFCYDTGGGVYVVTATVTVTDNQVFVNSAQLGSGLYLYGSDAALNGNTLSDNTAENLGGGLYLHASDATLQGNTISGNTAEYHGAGLYLEYGVATLDGNTISDNTAGGHAGGLWLGGEATLSGNTITANTAEYAGGGLYGDYAGATLIGNTIAANTADQGGGLCVGGRVTLSGNTIISNTANYGGGLHLSWSSSATLISNTFTANTANYGGGLYLEASSPTLTNNVVADNQANIAGSGLYIVFAFPHLLHTTIARNGGGDGSGVHVTNIGSYYSTVALTNTILVSHTVGITVTAGNMATLESTLWHGNATDWAGAGTITRSNDHFGHPAFVDPDGGDYHLTSTSAAIDRGVDAGIAEDMDGDVRPQGAAPDLGADEWLGLSIVKSGPSTVLAGEPVTYTLTVTNNGEETAANLVITDAIPTDASYVSGGTQVGDVVRWTIPSLAGEDSVSVSFVVTATTTVTNSDYSVVADGGISAAGREAVVTVVHEPIAGLSAANDSPTALGSPTTLTATITAGNNVTYTWAFGDGLTGSGAVVPHVYPAIGVYTAVVTANNSVSVMTATTTVTIYRTCWARLNDDPTDYFSVQAAVDASAYPTDVVKIAGYCAGVNPYDGLAQTVYINKTLTVRGGYTTTNWVAPDPLVNPTKLDAQGQGRVLYITGDPSAGSGQAISPTVEGLRITGGDAAGLGGHCPAGSCYDAGGGVYIVTATATLRDNQVFGNTAGSAGVGYGGGLYLGSSDDATLSGNTVTSNTAEYGAGLFLGHSGGALNANTILSNTAEYGGGLYLWFSDATLTNNVIADNQASTAGSGLYVERSSPRLLHTTAARNTGDNGVLASNESTVALTNTILVSHTVGIQVTSGSTATLESTLWHGNAADWDGTGTISHTNDYTGTPAFVDPDGGDYHLNPASAAVDKGVDAGVEEDMDGDVRPLGAAPDLGADEWLALAIVKSGPPTAAAGEPITYTLTITYSGLVTATNLVITDAIPAGAHYITGGLQVGNVVSWTLPSLAAGDSISVTFVVTADTTIVNDDYFVRADGNLWAAGQKAVVTIISGPPPLLWWDDDFFFRRQINLATSTPIAYSDQVTQVVSVSLDTAPLLEAGYLRYDGQDLRLLHWHDDTWTELPRDVTDPISPSVTVVFPLRESITDTTGSYYLYYGNPAADAAPGLATPYGRAGEPYVTIEGSSTITPTVAFSGEPADGFAPLAVTFANHTYPAADSYLWTFGDGATEVVTDPVHLYQDPGTYTITLEAVISRPGEPLPDEAWAWTVYTATQDGLVSDGVQAVAVDSTNNKWFGTDSGVSVLSADRSTWASFHDGYYYNAMAIGSGNVKWFGTDSGARVLDDGGTPFTTGDDTWLELGAGTCVEGQLINDIVLDAAGPVWFATDGSGLCVLDYGTDPLDQGDDQWANFVVGDGSSLQDNSLVQLAIDADGRVWIAGRQYGLDVFDYGAEPFNDRNDDAWMHLDVPGLDERGLNALAIDAADLKWIGSAGAGLFVLDDGDTPFDDADDTWTVYTVADGLADSYVTSIAFDADGNRWLGTGAGLSQLAADGSAWATYTAADGLGDDHVADVAVAPDAALWLTHGYGGVTAGVEETTPGGVGPATHITTTLTYPSYVWVAGLDRSGDVTVNLGQVETPVVTTTIWAGAAITQTLTSADGRLTVAFPPGAVVETVVVEHTPLGPISPAGSDDVVARFELEAATEQGEPVTAFARPLTLTLDYAADGLPGLAEATLAAFYWDEAAGEWQYLPTMIEPVSDTLTVRTNHFSESILQSTAGAASLPGTVNAAQSDLFSGAATWAYPLAVPPGRAGLQPNLALFYNSHLADVRQGDLQWAGWTGLGFSLEPGTIEIDSRLAYPTRLLDYRVELPHTTWFKDHFRLTLNGASVRLVRDGDWLPEGSGSDVLAHFKPQQENGMRIALRRGGENYTEAALLINGNGQVFSNPYWEVTTKDGTVYRFGYKANATEAHLKAYMPDNELGSWDPPSTPLKWSPYPGRAHLDLVTDVYGNQIQYTYEKEEWAVALLHPPALELEVLPVTDVANYTRWTRLTRIDYNDDQAHVDFYYVDTRLDLPGQRLLKRGVVRYYPGLLQRVTMSIDTATGTDDYLRYTLGYEHSPYVDRTAEDLVNFTPFLANIQVEGKEGGAFQPFEAATTLDYITNLVDPRRGRLSQINNGYGGQTTLDYSIGGKIQKIRSSAPNTTPVERHFRHLDLRYNRHAYTWETTEGDLSTKVPVTLWIFHDSADNPGPFDLVTPPRVGKLYQMHVYKVHQSFLSVLPTSVIPKGKPLQTTCMEYTNILSNDPITFVAPERRVTAFDREIFEAADVFCGSPQSDNIEVRYQYEYNVQVDDYNLTRLEELGAWGDADDDRVTTYTYESFGRVRGLVDVTEVRDGSGTLASKTDNDYVFKASGIGAVASLTSTTSDGSGDLLTSYTDFDDRGNVDEQWVGDPARAVSIEYDPDYHIFPYIVSYPQGLQTETHYDAHWGAVTEAYDMNGHLSQTTYDAFGRVKTAKGPAPDDATITYTYQNTGSGLDVTTSLSAGTPQTSVSRYDGLGRLVQTESDGPPPDQTVRVDYEYDAWGRLERQSLPYIGTPTGWTATEYDVLNRPVKVTNPDGTFRTLAYNNWRETTLTDEAGHVTVHTHDGLGRTTQVQDSHDQVTGLVYDALDNLTDVYDPEGNHVQMTYDGLGRQTDLNDPDLGLWSYQYDAAGNLLRQTDASGQSTCFYYDLLDRLKGKYYRPPGESCPADDPGYSVYDVKYYYDEAGHGPGGLGRRTSMADASGGTAWTFDEAGRVLQEVKTIGDDDYTTSFTYDPLGRVETMTYPDPSTGSGQGGEIVTYTYDRQGLLDQLTTSLSEGVYLDDVEYNALGQPLAMTLGSGALTASYVHYSPYSGPGRDFRLHLATVQNSAGTLQRQSYTYDKAGNVKTLAGQIGATDDDPIKLNLIYGYDDLYHLTGVSGRPYAHGYGYDNLGNLTKKDGLTLDYNNPRPHAVSGTSENWSFDYSPTGNLITKTVDSQVMSFGYDAENRLTEVVSGTTTTFVYDGDGRRVKKVDEGGTTVYVGEHYVVEASGELSGKINTSDGTVQAGVAAQQRELSMAVAEDGDTYVVWADNRDGSPSDWLDIYLRKYDATQGRWEAEIRVSGPPNNGIVQEFPSVALDQNENVYVVWEGGSPGSSAVYFRRYDVGTATWSEIEAVNDTGQGGFPDLAVDAAGNAYVTWRVDDHYIYFDQRPAGGNWGTDVLVSDSTSGTYVSNVSIATNGNQVGIVWYQYPLVAPQEEVIVYDQMLLPDGSWGVDQLLGSGDDPDLDIDATGNVYVVWSEYQTPSDDIWFRLYDAALEQWQASEVLTTMGDSLDPSVAVNAAGDHLTVVWAEYTARAYCDGSPKVWYRERLAGSSTWSTPQLVEPGPDFSEQMDPVVDVNGSGVKRIIWGDSRLQCAQGKTGEWDLYSNISVGSVTKHYYANGQRLATRVDGTLYYVLGDHLGSTTLVADAQGNEIGRVLYDPYGQIAQSTLPDGLTDQLFTGQRLDSSTGLYYYNARYYDPYLGRFIQPDTLVPDPLNPQAWNRFSYVYNNPTSYVDPSGHDPVTLLILGGAFLLGAGLGGYYAYHQGYGFDTWQFYAYAGMGGLGGVVGAGAGMWIEAALLPAGATVGQAFLAGAAGGVAGGVVEQSILEVGGAAILGTEVSAERILLAGATAGVMGGASGMASRWLRLRAAARGWLGPVPSDYRGTVTRAFEGAGTVETLSDDIIVYRHWGGIAEETGSPWFSPKIYARPGNARRYLALPSGTTAKKVSAFLIPSGTTIIRGKAASQVGSSIFGPYATGRGIQIYLPDISAAILLGQIR